MNKLTVIIISIAMIGFVVLGLGVSCALIAESSNPEDFGIVLLIMIAVGINAYIVLHLLPLDNMKARAHFRESSTMKYMERTKPIIDHKEFEYIYPELVNKYGISLNKMRKSIAIKKSLQIILLILAIGGGLLAMSIFEMKYSVLCLASSILFCITIQFKGNNVETYKKTYMETAFTGMIEALEDNELKELGIKESYNIAYAKDEMRFKTITYTKEPITYDNFGNNLMEINIHEGIRVSLSTNKSIESEIAITNSIEDLANDSFEKVVLDSEEFESMYNAYSDNSVLAMRIITSDIMELLSKAKMFLGLDIKIRIRNKNITLQIPMYDIIAVSSFSNNLNKDLLIEYYEIIKVIRKVMLGLYKEIENVEI